jgi:hypothetical protein
VDQSGWSVANQTRSEPPHLSLRQPEQDARLGDRDFPDEQFREHLRSLLIPD